jgi:cytochrome P450
MLLAADGVGNVQSGIANCLFVLLQQRTLPPQIFESPKARATLVDECLRLESPGQYQGRIAREAMTIGGRDIRAHSIVLLGLGSANRDPEAFTDPDRFDPARRRPQHLAFGSGAHMCMGSVLVRKEISAMLEAIFANGLKLRLQSAQGDWLARPGHRWLGTLWVNVSGGTSRP